ncbi:MAG: phage tail tape measure C-terminal domain-containing protein [Pseudomonadota bacterium]
MSETLRLTLDPDEFRQGMETVREEFETLVEQDLSPLAQSLERTFEQLGDSIGDNLEKASVRGRLSVKSLVDDVLADLTRLAADQFIRAPLENALGDILGSIGGRGPGVPATVSRPVNVNISMTSGSSADPLGRSGGQLAGIVNRALTRALRNG